MSTYEHGWGWPLRANKPHYFIEGSSLCGRWNGYGGPLESGRGRDQHDCQACVSALAKSPAAQAPAAPDATTDAFGGVLHTEVRH
ncbi:MAG: hypothetical protein ACREPC_08000 [Stenotrophomonas sp.]|uniref:hypothetical protein n=1 Tax=Stenotrophomonas sp. TaxID=69392 RepID=UPI003D6CB8D4